ncbi:unnamed protein product [Amoebophrya sp. A25]|nr:unnamed protein product [Amoebophrya sp. A25]|eukprot:GSA25T00017478001.1
MSQGMMELLLLVTKILLKHPTCLGHRRKSNKNTPKCVTQCVSRETCTAAGLVFLMWQTLICCHEALAHKPLPWFLKANQSLMVGLYLHTLREKAGSHGKSILAAAMPKACVFPTVTLESRRRRRAHNHHRHHQLSDCAKS